MLRRIKFRTVERKINSYEAIRPRQGDRETSIRETTAKVVETQDDNGHRMVVSRVTSTKKEVIRGHETISSKVDYRRTLIIDEYLPKNTASEEVFAGGDEAARPESNRRLRKLGKIVLQRIDKLLYECFLQGFAKKFGEETAKALVTWIKLSWLWLPILALLLKILLAT